jgi:hypothetical protein
VQLDLKSQMLYAGRLVFFNGECIDAAGWSPRLQQLADLRALRVEDGDAQGLIDTLYGWYRAGQLHLGERYRRTGWTRQPRSTKD